MSTFSKEDASRFSENKGRAYNGLWNELRMEARFKCADRIVTATNTKIVQGSGEDVANVYVKWVKQPNYCNN